MADDNLDDFFAKKDKSKKKSKSSKLTPSDILAQTDETTKKGKKSKKDKDKTQTTNSSNTTDGHGLIVNPAEEEEWNEVVEEQAKDYTGLRIANLQVSQKGEDGEQGGEEEAEDGEDDGEGQERKDRGKQGPWEAGGQPPIAHPPAEPAAPAVEDLKPKEEPAGEKTGGKYMTPAARAAAAAGGVTPSAGPTLPGHIRKKKAAPNLRSEMDFPTLGGNTGPFQSDSDTRNFEQVQHGGRQMENAAKIAQQVSLGNKFSALQD
ncbi:protein CDV3 homolog isoform X2 [Mya arenaria]|uniref:protein CDV3 homolog isoform X2 n=1 Tax=Mya arenaria TaxID=6604 RepID=UPI0022DEEE80|nr:protein CDV3 homolog isoform X2 [Mya arenaria]